MESKRVYLWDNIKGILIFLVVLGHFLYDYNSLGISKYIVDTIYMFHMPAFIFISGYFSKKESTHTKLSIYKLLCAYFIFNLLLIITSIFTGGLNSVSLLYPYNSMWYILALIVWRLTVKPLAKIPNILPISVIISLMLGFWGEFDNKLAICRILVFLPFFLAGYKFKAQSFEKIANMRKLPKHALGVLITAAAVFASVYIIKNVNIPAEAYVMTAYKSGSHAIYRPILFVMSAIFIIGFLLLLPNVKIPYLSKIGRNSLSIYLLHRPFTLIFSYLLSADFYSEKYVAYAVLLTIALTFGLGGDKLSEKINAMLEHIAHAFCVKNNDKKLTKAKTRATDIAIYTLIILLLINPLLKLVNFLTREPVSAESYGPIYNVLTKQDSDMLENSLSVMFVGDLILLKNQVYDAYNEQTKEYNFDDVFRYTKPYFDEADYTIGVFEGPMAGEERGYTTSNFNDNLPLYLNFPDEFAQAVKRSGIDFVTTANNHLLDMGIDGAMRTLDVLDRAGLEHSGSYRNKDEKQKIKIIKIGELNCAVLAYTYGSNYYESSYFIDDKPDLTSLICAPNEKYFDVCKKNVYDDFAKAKDLGPDLIIVLPHMGTQFSHKTDVFQDTWNDIFIDAGADIILGGHAHAVQPIEYRTNGEKTSVIVNCPGNFANSYCANDGDATAAVKIYIDPQTAQVNAVSVIPMYTYAQNGGQYCAAPIYTLIKDASVSQKISKYEMKRIKKVHTIIANVMLGTEIPIENIEEEYVLLKSGYARGSAQPLDISKVNTQSIMYKVLSASKSVCFIGDSLTEGTANGGVGWYEPMTAMFPELTVYNCSKGGATSETLLERSDEFSEYKADSFVIAVGTNDVRYRDTYNESSSEDYIENIKKMVTAIRTKRPDAAIVLVSPWCAMNSDPIIRITAEQRDTLLAEYSSALKAFADDNGCKYINVSSHIADLLKTSPSDLYLTDHIHPNAYKGIELYSMAAMNIVSD